VVVTDHGDSLETLITSANPHDGSSAHGNSAIKVASRQLARDVIDSEQAVADLVSVTIEQPKVAAIPSRGEVVVQLLTEGAIRERLVNLIDESKSGDSLDLAMFYLSERRVVESLKRASFKDVNIRLILDPNKDAFGHTKIGIPNRSVAHELVGRGRDIKVRWCDTHGEQCHTKLVILTQGDRVTLLNGSANLTRRNIGDFNLETNVLVQSRSDVEAITEARGYFEELWTNDAGRQYTVLT
jgi:Phosphatidylserine/phosphatidylglycerophosphate/cardiolipin synthases and related enzymes